MADIVIIGGGISGLSAGLAIADANAAAKAANPNAPQVSFVVLEGTPRFGGRTLTRDVDLDFGGGYIGATQNYLQWLIHRFQLQTITEFLPNDEKFKWLYEDGQGNITRFPGNDPFAFPGGNNALALLLQLDGMALEVRNHLSDPNSSIQAGLDNISAQDFIDQQRAAWDAVHPAGAPIPNPDPNFAAGMSPQTAEVFAVSVRSAFSVEPKELSFFFLLYYAATAGGYSALVDVSGGAGAAEGTRFALGTQSLVAALIDQNYPNVWPNSVVQDIDYSAPQGATITLKDGTTFAAKQVVVAMSPPASAKLNYVPALSTTPDGQKRVKLCADMQSCLGRTIKGFVRFKTAFWRERSLMGFLLSSTPDPNKYPLDWTLDNVWVAPDNVPYSGSGERSSLMTFIVGAAADHWSTQSLQARADAVIAHLRLVFPFTNADLLDPTNPAGNYVEENWPLQTGAGVGSPNANMPKGTLTNYGSALFTPIGPIHWAGSESATEWCGYMNGAVQAGFRAATEALAELAAAAAPAAAPKAPGAGSGSGGPGAGSGGPSGPLAGGNEAA
jgi:monoamine oxidase